MNLSELIRDNRTSIRQDVIDGTAYGRALRHLRGYNFWDGTEGMPRLWEHQQAAIATVLAYLNGEKAIPERPEQKEAALLKLPTGTGKSGIVAVLARCLPDVRRALVLTPRTALTEQLMADIRYRFWKHMGFEHEGTALFTAEAEMFGSALESVYVQQFLPKNVDMIVQHLIEAEGDRAILVGTHQALGDIRKRAHNPESQGSANCVALLAHIQDVFDLVIVDEGHYEPAISWSRGVREFNLPTLLLSATPYRNDYKSFRVRGRYLFNFPYAANKGAWYSQSIFGLFSVTCDEVRDANGIADDDLTKAIEAVPIWLCDDDNREAADFIGVDPDGKKIMLVHAKVGKQQEGGQGFNVGGLQDVGRQALASLGFISRGQPSTIWTPERWQTDVHANKVTLDGRSRIFRNPDGLTAEQMNDLLRASCRNPSFDREIWIVGAKMARRQALADGLDQAPWENRLRQFLMHWDAMQTACARANTRLRFYCST